MMDLLRKVACVLCLLALGLTGLAAETGLPPALKESTYLNDLGTVKHFFRSQVVTADLDMPLWVDGLQLNSGAFRVRDRKNRDLVKYAFIKLTTAHTVDEIADFYQQALGRDARRETDAATGNVLVFYGSKANCRIVTITPHTGYCGLLLEHVEHFALPTRVYSDREQQVIRVLEEVSREYQTAEHVAYTMQLQVEAPAKDGEPAPPVLNWTVDFHRPAQLTVRATANDTLGLEITTKDGKLIINRPGAPADERGIGDAITSETAPELGSDPVARLMFGDTLVSDEVDYYALAPVGDKPIQQQADIVLTFPEDFATLHLWIDRQQKRILRAETVITQDNQQTHLIRTYGDIVVEPAAVTPPAASLQQPPPVPSDTVTTP